MAKAAIKLKIMPKGTETDLKKLKQSVEKKIKELGGIISSIEEEPVAFGLKALIATIAWPEEKDTFILENIELDGISSCQIIDYRRAVG